MVFKKIIGLLNVSYVSWDKGKKLYQDCLPECLSSRGGGGGGGGGSVPLALLLVLVGYQTRGSCLSNYHIPGDDLIWFEIIGGLWESTKGGKSLMNIHEVK